MFELLTLFSSPDSSSDEANFFVSSFALKSESSEESESWMNSCDLCFGFGFDGRLSSSDDSKTGASAPDKMLKIVEQN